MPPQDLVNATTGAAPSTLGASMYPEISQMNAIGTQMPTSTGLANASVGEAEAQVARQKVAASLAEQKAADLADPKKYRQVKNATGGYDFYDPDGSKIDVATLTQRTQTKPSDWLSDSEDAGDIQYINDTKNLQGLLQAVASKDAAALAQYRQGFVDNEMPDITKMNVQDILDKYKTYYKKYYTSGFSQASSSNPVVPSPQTANPMSLTTDNSGGI